MNVTFVLSPFNMSSALGTTTKMKRGFLPSLGIGHLASMVEARGHETRLVDAQVMDLNHIQTADMILERDAGVVAFSLMCAYAHATYAVAQLLKERAPEILIVMGGPHCTTDYKAVFEECPHVDVVIPGDGEVPFANLVDKVAAKEEYRDVKGISYRKDNGEIFLNGHAEAVANLDDLPHPSRKIFEPYPYRALPNQVRHEPSTTSITSRGCSWGKCTFCYQGGEFSPRYRRRSPKNVVAELIPLVKEYGNKEIIFWDDTFAVNPRWIDEFCDELDREKLDITWSCYGHMRAVRPRMLKRMAASGCYNLYYGFESGVQELLDLIKKGTTRKQIRETVQWTKDAGIEIRGSFILGFPSETPEQTLETIRFACELNADWMMFFPFRVVDGTPIEALAHSTGTIIEDISAIRFPEYVSEGYQDIDQLHAMVRRAYRKYYLRPRYWGLVARNLAKRPYLFKYYYDAVKFWIELTKSGYEPDPSEKPAAQTH